MLSLFFLLSFVNTLLDSLKDTLVVTAVGGGAAVLPFLSLYAVLPTSVAFLVAYSWASQRMSRAALFNAIIFCFSLFFAVFAFVLMPNADALHLHELCDALQQALPAGLAGGIGMIRLYVFTLFFVSAELWGDCCMGLLFWGLANEITSQADAPTLYPLFGLGANLAQATAGMVLKAMTAARATGGSNFTREVQATMGVVLAMAAAAALLHTWIATTSARPARQAELSTQGGGRKAAPAAAGDAAVEKSSSSGGSSSSSSNGKGELYSEAWRTELLEKVEQQQHSQQRQAGSSNGSGPGGAAAAIPPDAAEASDQQSQPKMTLRETLAVLMGSLEIRCLAVMSLAQGLCTSLLEFTWKHHIRLLYPNPSDFTAFLGDVAVATGATTAALMLCSPMLFQALGWKGVPSTTPQLLLWGGGAFFIASIYYQWAHGAAAAAAAAAGTTPATGGVLLPLIVLGGALVFVTTKGAKFSLFKPAEEMVYLALDDDNLRTRGKAAIDVVGSQTGKSAGSILQQLLLVACAGAISGPILPLLFVTFLTMVRGWQGAVRELSHRRRYTLYSPITSLEEDSEERPAAGAAAAAAAAVGGAGPGSSAVVIAPPRPAEVGVGGGRMEAAELTARLQDLQQQDSSSSRREGGDGGGGSGSSVGSVAGSGSSSGGTRPTGL